MIKYWYIDIPVESHTNKSCKVCIVIAIHEQKGKKIKKN